MKQESVNEAEGDIREEYDLSQLKNRDRGKYAEQYKAGTNLVLLEPDVALVFTDAESVNQALRLLIRVAKTSGRAEQDARTPPRNEGAR